MSWIYCQRVLYQYICFLSCFIFTLLCFSINIFIVIVRTVQLFKRFTCPKTLSNYIKSKKEKSKCQTINLEILICLIVRIFTIQVWNMLIQANSPFVTSYILSGQFEPSVLIKHWRYVFRLRKPVRWLGEMSSGLKCQFTRVERRDKSLIKFQWGMRQSANSGEIVAANSFIYFNLCDTSSISCLLISKKLRSWNIANSMAYGTRTFNAAFTRALQ